MLGYLANHYKHASASRDETPFPLCKKIKRNSAGFGLIEVMIFALVIAIICVAIITALNGLRLEVKKQRVINTLENSKMIIATLLSSKDSWLNTVNANSNMACLRSPYATRCDGSDMTAPGNFVKTPASDNEYLDDAASEIILKDGSTSPGQTFYDGVRATNSVTGMGFTESGTPCTGFVYPPAAGNDNCPVGYVINWHATTNMPNPKIVVVARMLYNPATSTIKNLLYSNLVDTAPTTKYDVVVVRTAERTQVNFKINYYRSGLTGPYTGCFDPGTTYGKCAVGAALFPESALVAMSTTAAQGYYDPYQITTVNAAAKTFHISQPGKYKCDITARIYRTDSSMHWIATTTAPSTKLLSQTSDSSSYSGSYGGLTNIAGQGVIIVPSGGADYGLYRVCRTTNTCGDGYATSASDTTAASIKCIAIED